MIVCDDVTAELSRGAFEGLCLLQLSLVRNSGNASLIAGDCSPEYAYTATLVRLVASAGEMRGKAGAGRQCGRTGVCAKCLPPLLLSLSQMRFHAQPCTVNAVGEAI